MALNRKTLVATAAAGFALAPMLAPAVQPLGIRETLVNTTTLNDQFAPSVASDAIGNYVVVWTSSLTADGSGLEVRGQRYLSNGTRNGAEFVVASDSLRPQFEPSVAMDALGNFVVAWTKKISSTDTDIYARRYLADGTAGSTIAVVVPSYRQEHPDVALNNNGDLAIVWQTDHETQTGGFGLGIQYQRYVTSPSSTTMTLMGGATSGTVSVDGTQTDPAAAMQADGRLLIVHVSDDYLALSYVRAPAEGVGPYFARYYDSAAGETRSDPDIAIDPDGDVNLVWEYYDVNADPSYGIAYRRLSAAGDSTDVVALAKNGSPASVTPSIATDAYGRSIVAWSQQGVSVQALDGDGQPVGPTLRAGRLISTFTTPAVSVDADGDAVVVFTASSGSAAGAGSDTSGKGVFSRRLAGDEVVDVTVHQSDSVDPAPAGSPLSYTITAGNAHAPAAPTNYVPFDNAVGAATSVRVVDVAPNLLSASGTNWFCTVSIDRAVCDYLLPLLAGAEAPPITVNLTAPAAPGTVLSNPVRVSADQLDDRPDNNRAVERTRIACPDSVVQFSAASYAVAENAGNATITATRTGGSCGAVSVQYDSAGSSATPGLDFTDVSGVLTWADGDTAPKTFTVPIGNDALDEIDERVALKLGPVGGGTLGVQSVARIVITDDDASPRVNFTASAQSVGETPQLIGVTAMLSGVSGRDVSIPLGYSGTATNGADYFPGIDTLVIPAGQTSASTQVEVAGDAVDEPNETVIVTMGAPIGATTGSIGTHTVTIVDDDDTATLPTVSFTQASSTGDETVARTATLQLSAARATAVTVPFTIGGSASNGPDYTLSRTSPVTFDPGVTQVTIKITPVDDVIDEPAETVVLTLGTPTGAQPGAITVHTRTIGDNDPP